MRKKLRNIAEYPTVFSFGALLYGAIEILFRGFTHWTMLLTGGFCLAIYHKACKLLKRTTVLIKAFFGSAIFTLLELIAGLIVNIKLKWNIWDYSRRFMNYKGQICPLFSFLWFLISIPAAWICSAFEFFCGEKPREKLDTEKKR